MFSGSLGHLMHSNTSIISLYQWGFQDPKKELLYHIRPYFLGVFTHTEASFFFKYLQFRFLKWPLILYLSIERRDVNHWMKSRDPPSETPWLSDMVIQWREHGA